MKKYGLIGYPLKHSFSFRFFGDKFKDERIDAVYNNYEISNIRELVSIVSSNSDLKGLNVTIPYKEQVFSYLDEIDHIAEKIGAVNVIKIIRDGSSIKLKGYNSDVIGFQNSISPILNKEVHKKALILGTGGAAKAVFYGLKELGINSKYVSRSENINSFTYNDLSTDIINEFKVIVNASPLGTFPNVDECPDIPYKFLTENHLLYDLVYNPPLTKFLTLGEKQGAYIKNGYEMLELQALAAWDIWNKKEK